MSRFAYNSVSTSVKPEEFVALWNQRGPRLVQAVNGKQDAYVVDSRDFGDVGGGNNDDTAALRKLAAETPDGGYALLAPGSYVVTDSIKNTVGKNITWLFYGQILDRCSTWTDITNDSSLDGKGIFAFSGGKVSVIGMGLPCYDGGANVAGVSQNSRHMFYFYNCSSVRVQGLSTNNGIGRAVGTYGCSNIVHKDCLHSGGYAIVVHRSPTTCICDNVNTVNGIDAGISIGNRGFLDVAVLPWNRAKNSWIINSHAEDIQNPDPTGVAALTAGVAFTIDSCDKGGMANCTVDGTPYEGVTPSGIAGQFAYSFADSTDLTVVGNGANDYNNAHKGNQLPGGLGMEVVRVSNSSFLANRFTEVMCAYQLSDCQDVQVDGVYTNVLGKTTSLSDAAVCSFATISHGTGTAPDNVSVRGQQNGGNYGVVLSGACGRVDVEGLHSRNLYRSFVSGQASSSATLLNIRGVSSKWSGAVAQDAIDLSNVTVTELELGDFRLEAGSVGAGFNALKVVNAGARVRLDRGKLKNFDNGTNAGNIALTELSERRMDFTGCNTRRSGTGSVVNFSAKDQTTAGVPIADE